MEKILYRKVGHDRIDAQETSAGSSQAEIEMTGWVFSWLKTPTFRVRLFVLKEQRAYWTQIYTIIFRQSNRGRENRYIDALKIPNDTGDSRVIYDLAW